MTCQYCRQEMALLFNGYYCKNHCDLPADKKAAAQKKDQEAKARANSQSHQAGSGVATPVSPPVEICKRCNQPAKWHSGWVGTYCINSLPNGSICGGSKPTPNGTSGYANIDKSSGGYFPITINWGGQQLTLYPDPDCPPGVLIPVGPIDPEARFCNPATAKLVDLYEGRDNLRRHGLVSGR